MRNTTIGGKSFEVASEPADYWGWVAEGRYNHEWAVYDKYLKHEHTFIDLGAWVGAHSLYASTIAKRVIAVEPDPVAYKILLNNTYQNYPLIQTLPWAISNIEGIVKIGSGLLGASTTRINPNAGGGIGPWVKGQQTEATCWTLLKLLADVPDPLFIKIDVEGAEELIFTDVDFFKERKPTILIELHPFWWTKQKETWEAFEKLKSVYNTCTEVHHKNSNTWVMNA